MEFRKIKFVSNKVHLEYSTKGGDQFVLEGKEAPLQSFLDALSGMKAYFIHYAELELESDVNITGVSISLDKKGNESIIITGVKHLSSGKTILISTPIAHIEDWSNEMFEAVDALKTEARKYVNGSRKYEQATLFDQDFDKSDEEIDNEKKHKQFAQLKKEDEWKEVTNYDDLPTIESTEDIKNIKITNDGSGLKIKTRLKNHKPGEAS